MHMAFNDARQCKAKSRRSGKRCKNAAVIGKDVCRMHGAKAGSPAIHGRYSLHKRQSLQSKIKQFYNDPQAGDLRSELALMRALLQDYIDRFEDGIPLGVDDIGRMYAMVDGIGKTVERIAKILAMTALTQAELQLLQVTLIDALSEFVPEPDRQRAFVSRVFGAISSGAGSNSRALSADIE